MSSSKHTNCTRQGEKRTAKSGNAGKGKSMDRQEFMDIIYAEFESDPDNVRANRIIEAADAYAESAHSKVEEDTISRQAEQKRTEKRTETHGVCLDVIYRQAVKQLDLFTKTYCRDKSVEDDLVFRCNQCDFEMPNDKCLVKVMARKLCPDYRDFGCMGDL
jgi:hypothetical protein